MSGFWSTVKLLMRYARVRSEARGKRQQQLMRQRNAGREGIDWGCLGVVAAVVFTMIIHGMFAWLHSTMQDAVWRVTAKEQGQLIVKRSDYDSLKSDARQLEEVRQEQASLELKVDTLTRRVAAPGGEANTALAAELAAAGSRLTVTKTKLQKAESSLKRTLHWAAPFKPKQDRDKLEREYMAHYEKHGVAGFISEEELLQNGQRTAAHLLCGTLVLLWWFIMQAFQGEGLELDFQRRRHPMWEWLLSHPVKPQAVFAAEMLSPLAANPLFRAAPMLWIVLYWQQYGAAEGVFYGILIGLPMAMAACFMSKSIEIAVMLRLSPRTRGGVLGILSWLGYASLFGGLIMINTPALAEALARGLSMVTRYVPLNVPLGDWMLGQGLGEASPLKGMIVCLIFAAGMAALSIWFSAWATNKGLAGGFGSLATAPDALNAETSRRWLRDPLHRKELLWFWRDKSAVVQVILLPLTMAAYQAWNLRHLAEAMPYSWHVVSGMAVLFGTYFLFIIGPRSLVSEGSALWIPLSWPRGLEDLLKAKARLWWMLSSLVVTVGLALAVFLFPADAWKIAIIAAGWYLFGGSLAVKSVTLVSAASSSGEPEPIPTGRRWAASLGTFTFAIGVLSEQWSMAFVGMVFSWITCAAMWQNFRARMPFLFDPWEERLPPPPTLMHAMVAVSAMVEFMALPMAAIILWVGKDQMLFARSIGYALTASLTAIIMDTWLANRGVRRSAIWSWPADKRMAFLRKAAWTLGGALVLAAFGVAYSQFIQRFPEINESVVKMAQHLAADPSERVWLFAMAVGFAPLAEEYLFRGLLYRALDREWGGWKAMIASAAFFAIYHPPYAWPPVFAVGLFNAWLFKRGGSLLPCVIVHAIYNAIIVLMT